MSLNFMIQIPRSLLKALYMISTDGCHVRDVDPYKRLPGQNSPYTTSRWPPNHRRLFHKFFSIPLIITQGVISGMEKKL